MPVEAVSNANTNNQRRTCIVPMAKGAVIGSATGYALKYAYPLIKDEKNTSEYRAVVKDIHNKQTTFSPWTKSFVENIKTKETTSRAEDIFVKTFDGMKVGEKVGTSRILGAFREIAKQKPDEATELSKLFQRAKQQAETLAKKHIEIYNLATKHIRPTGFFVVTGAVAGAAVALAHSVLRTEVKES